MTSLQQLRASAAGLPQVREETRRGAPAFSVAGRVFAAATPDRRGVLLWLAADDAAAALAAFPAAAPFTRGQHDLGASVPLAQIDGQQLNRWVRQAWKHRAPRRLLAATLAAEGAQPGAGDLPASIGRPATRALLEAGLTTLEDVAVLSDSALAAVHGVGPKAVRLLREAAAERGLG